MNLTLKEIAQIKKGLCTGGTEVVLSDTVEAEDVAKKLNKLAVNTETGILYFNSNCTWAPVAVGGGGGGTYFAGEGMTLTGGDTFDWGGILTHTATLDADGVLPAPDILFGSTEPFRYIEWDSTDYAFQIADTLSVDSTNINLNPTSQFNMDTETGALRASDHIFIGSSGGQQGFWHFTVPTNIVGSEVGFQVNESAGTYSIGDFNNLVNGTNIVVGAISDIVDINAADVTLNANSLNTLGGFVTVQPIVALSGATPSWDFSQGSVAQITVPPGNTFTLSITNAVAPSFGSLKVTTVGSSDTIVLPAGSQVVNDGGGVIVLTPVVGATDWLCFIYDGTNYWWTSLPNFS